MNSSVTSDQGQVTRCVSRHSGHPSRVTRCRSAFSLVEVMIALAIFFMCVFTILGLISTVLRNARLLQNKKGVDAGLVAAQLCLTNKLTEEVESGDFGDMYPDYDWTRDTYEVGTNGLFQVDIIVQRHSGSRPVESKMSILLFRPESSPGSLSGGMRR
jgi:type II secretory pathway pseudopilin PulG